MKISFGKKVVCDSNANLIQMKKLLIIPFMFLFLMVGAQNITTQAVPQQEVVEEVQELGIEQQVDSTIFDADIMASMAAGVELDRDTLLLNVLNRKVAADSSSLYNGFRIRIYLDSKRGAREASEAAIKKFNEKYPYILAYRTYIAPNFKVSVGNFRTRMEAENFLNVIKEDFPEAFIVREKFKYPSMGRPDLRQLPETEIFLEKL